MLRIAVAFAAACAVANAHTMMTYPTSRNAMDRHLPAFDGGKSPATPCTCSNGYEKVHPFNATAAPAVDAPSGSCWTDVGYNYNDRTHNIKTVAAAGASACCGLCGGAWPMLKGLSSNRLCSTQFSEFSWKLSF